MLRFSKSVMRVFGAGCLPGVEAASCLRKVKKQAMTAAGAMPSIAHSRFHLETPMGDASSRIHGEGRQAVPGCWWRGLALIGALLYSFNALAVTPNHGDSISNNVTVSSSVGNASASVDVTAIVRTASVVEFLQYAPGAPTSEAVVTSACGDPIDLNSNTITLPANVDLQAVTYYQVGEPIFVRLNDPDQNLNFSLRETVAVDVSIATLGDSETLTLTETTVSSGIFVGYIQSTATAGAVNDCSLTIANNEPVNADYVDSADATDSTQATVLVDPFGIVFDSTSGAPVDNAAVTLIDVATGLPATTVLGDNGAAYPATVITGSTFSVGGILYVMPPGGYRFPQVPPGNYRLEVAPPPGYGHPSSVATPVLQTLPGAPYAIDAQASRRLDFVLNPGPALHVDIPVDAAGSGLFMTKTAGKAAVGIGDFLQYTLRLENLTASAIAGVTIGDRLPQGFRYQSGSAKVDGASIADPTVSADGRNLVFAIGNIPASTVIDVRYVVEVGSGSPLGEASNSASATAGGFSSNTATAMVTVREDLLRSRSHVMGRVIVDQCENGPPVEGGEGLAGVRLYLEDGSYVITDEKGLYHFEGLRPGTHVLQLDVDSLPPTVEVFECERNTRVAGSARSRFVDLQGGTVWRSDFYVRPKPPLYDDLGLRMLSAYEGSLLKFTVNVRGESLIYKNRRLRITLPQGVGYRPGSSRLEGVAIADPDIEANSLIYDLGDSGKQKWKQTLQFSTHIEKSRAGEHSTQAVLLFDTEAEQGKQSEVAQNRFVRRDFAINRYEFRGNFEAMEARLRQQDQGQLDETVKQFAGKRVQHIEVIAHTDSMPIADKHPLMFADNYVLSLARAKSVGEYLRQALGLDPEQIRAIGKGPDEPVASNSTEAGRLRNRRVELRVVTSEEHIPPLVITLDDSGPVYSEVVVQYTKAGNKPGTANTVKAEDQPLGILSLREGQRLAQRSNSVRVRLDSGLKPQLFIDGKAVSEKRIGLRAKDNGSGKTLYAYFGVDLGERGEHTVSLKGVGPFGNVRYEQHITVVRTGEIANIRILDSEGNAADGKRPIIVRVQLLDEAGEAIAASAELELLDSKLVPHTAQARLPEIRQENRTVKVDEKGVIRFMPSNRSGLYHGVLAYNGVAQEFKTYVKPQYRDWIMVGLAEGTVGHKTLSGNMQNLDAADLEEGYYQDGRLAFFAKGQIQGKWLLTMAYDSDKDKDEAGNALHQYIDPKAYYTLYGDASQQGYDAASTEKLYIKLESDQFYAMFGDYTTGLTVTELSRYSRSLTGIKTEFESEHFSVTAFASETDQAFVKDEILGDGTSGLYRLSRQNIVTNSEKIIIETRDRFHSERVISSRSLTRYIDYSLDPVEGTVYFKEPIYSQDENFNPIYIVVDYEAKSSDDEDIIAGGRAAVKAMQGRIELGASVIHEGTTGAEGDLHGADLKLRLSQQTEIRAEVAESENMSGTFERSGSAYLAEIAHQGKRLHGRAYVREQDEGFGLGQQKGSESGTQKFGADARYRQTEHLTLHGEAWREENLTTEATRDVAHAKLEYREDNYSLSGGLRHASDKDGLGEEHVSELLTAGASYAFMDKRVNLRANTEIALGDNENPDFPSRLILGLDYRFTQAVKVFAEQEYTQGENQDSQSTRVGVLSTPWKGATLSTAVENQATEYGPRTFSSVGLTQGMQITPQLSVDFGLDRSKTMRDPGDVPFNVNVPPASGTTDNDFIAASMGATYREALWSATARIEGRDAELENKASLLFGFYRQQTPGLGFSTSLQYFDTDYSNGNRMANGDLRLLLAYRPTDNRWIVLNRMDFIHDLTLDSSGENRSRKFVNNLNTNYLINRSNQIAIQYGFKYALDTFDDDEYNGVTQLFGTEYRHDINARWDIGLRAGMLHSSNANSYDYSWGLATGVNVAKNTWLSLGYNFEGFRDSDFSGADYTAAGPYLKLRISMDRQTSRDVLAWWERWRNVDGNAAE